MIFARSLATLVLLGLGVAACSSSDDDAAAPSPAPTPAPSPAPTPAPDTGTMSADQSVAKHIDVVQRRIAANNAKDWNTWESLHTENAVRTAPTLPAPLVGAKAMRAGIEELVTTFPDYHLEFVEAFGSGDRLVARIHTRATMLGPLPLGEITIPPTGKTFEQDWVALLRFEGDRIAAIDEFFDNYDTMVQLGLTQ